jgi:hypothetical protein
MTSRNSPNSSIYLHASSVGTCTNPLSEFGRRATDGGSAHRRIGVEVCGLRASVTEASDLTRARCLITVCSRVDQHPATASTREACPPPPIQTGTVTTLGTS